MNKWSKDRVTTFIAAKNQCGTNEFTQQYEN